MSARSFRRLFLGADLESLNGTPNDFPGGQPRERAPWYRAPARSSGDISTINRADAAMADLYIYICIHNGSFNIPMHKPALGSCRALTIDTERSSDHAPVDRDDEARDQHLLAGADAAGAVWPWPGPLYGEAAIRAYRGTGTGLGAYLDLAEREGAEIVLPIAAGAPPSGPVEDDAYAHITDAICDAVARGGFDGIMLDLHGAMVTESLEDGEGEFLKRLRAIDPKTPIAVSLDMHANLYDAMIANATVVTGYRTYPHIDTYETAKLAGEILLRAIRGEVKPVMAWGNVPMLPHVMRQGTDDHPNKELQRALRRDERRGCAWPRAFFTGFPHADITNAGLSAVVVTDGDRKLAEELRDELLGPGLGRARGLCLPDRAAAAIGRPRQGNAAAPSRRGPDRAARPLRQLRLGRHDGHDRRARRDPARKGSRTSRHSRSTTPRRCSRRSPPASAARSRLSIGGKIKMPAIPGESPPLTVTGTVKTISNGRFQQPRADGARRRRWIWVRRSCSTPGTVEIVLISRHVEPSDLNCLLEPRHRPDAKALCDAEEPHPLAGRARSDGQGRRRMRRGRRMHLGLWAADSSTRSAAPIYPLDLPNR